MTPAVHAPICSLLTAVLAPLCLPRTATAAPTNVGDPALPPPLQGLGNVACCLASSVAPCDAATLDTLHPSPGAYVHQVAKSASGLRRQRLLLPRDAARIVVEAAHSQIGCGLGFELASVVPALVWAPGRRAGRRVSRRA